MADYNNLFLGLRVQSQIPLNAIEYAPSEAALKNLGIGNNLAYCYPKGLIVYCISEGSRYEWKEVPSGQNNTVLLTTDFVYPDELVVFGIDYSLKRYNFFPVTFQGNEGPQGEPGPQGVPGVAGPQGAQGVPGPAGTNGKTLLSGTVLPVIGIGTVGDFYINLSTSILYGPKTASSWGSGISLKGDKGDIGAQGLPGPPGPQGIPGANGQDALSNLQKTIVASANLDNTYNNHTVNIDNGTSDIVITISTGLIGNFSAGFVKKGTGKVSFMASGTVINTAEPGTLTMKGILLPVYLEQIGTSNSFDLMGNLIV
jgi:Collagen triple helix repeat (20 copies)